MIKLNINSKYVPNWKKDEVKELRKKNDGKQIGLGSYGEGDPMLFHQKHIQSILSGIKTATRRDWKTPHAIEGGTYKCKTKMISKYHFAKIKATQIYKQKLKDMTEEDAKKEGGYTLEEFKKIWVEIYYKWDPEWEVTVIEFELIKEE